MNLIKWFKESISLYKHTPALYERCLQISFPGSMFGAHSRQQRTSTNKTETQQRLTIAFSYFVTVVRQKIYLYLTLCEPISDHRTAIDLNQNCFVFQTQPFEANKLLIFFLMMWRDDRNDPHLQPSADGGPDIATGE